MGMGLGLGGGMPVFIKCDDKAVAQPKPAGQCAAPVTQYCEYTEANCIFTNAMPMVAALGSSSGGLINPYLPGLSHFQCDMVDGACPTATKCANTGLSERTRLALRVQQIDQSAAQRGEKIQ